MRISQMVTNMHIGEMVIKCIHISKLMAEHYNILVEQKVCPDVVSVVC